MLVGGRCCRLNGKFRTRVSQFSSNKCEHSRSRRSEMARSGSRRTQSARGGRRCTTGLWRDDAALDSATLAGLAENDEILSSWLTRSAALYRVRPETLLEQLGISEVVPAVLDRRALPMDLERLSVAMRSSPEAIPRMTFADETPGALVFVARRFPLWTCRRPIAEFPRGELAQVRLRTWFIVVAPRYRRCGGHLTTDCARASRALHNIIADGEPYELYATVRDRLAHAFKTRLPVGAVTGAMRALAAPVPTNNWVRYLARNRGRMPSCPHRVPPLLWQLAGTQNLLQLMHGYQYWRPPDARPYAAWQDRSPRWWA
jgi:hypothetical protein